MLFRSKPDHVASGVWFNFQLPLYRHLAAEVVDVARAKEEGKLALGYFRLPRRSEDVGVVMADWTAEELADADAAASVVVGRVRGGEFAEIGEEVVTGGSIDRMCGVGFLGQYAPLLDDVEEEPE